MQVTLRGVKYAVHPRPDLAIAGKTPWCIVVGGGTYQVSDHADWAIAGARRFSRERLGNNPELTPGLTASERFPLLLSIDRTVVRAWPAFELRGRGAKTYETPATGERVATLKRWPSWIFETEHRPASAFGTMTGEQTIADVIDLATLWLKSPNA